MGLFKKKSSVAEPADEDLTFFTASKANEFRALAREVFAELGYEVQINPDHAIDADGRGYGFWNVAANCHAQPEGKWRGIIREHVQKVLASFEAPDPFEDLTSADVAGRLYARLYDEAAIPGLDAYPHSEFVPGVVEMLALDLPETVAVFTRENAARFGGWQALREQGLANLRALDNEQLETLEAPGGGVFWALLGNSVYTASKALLLPGLAAELTGRQTRDGHGFLMSVPNRHQVVWHVIGNDNLFSVLNGMVRFTAMGYSDAPGPVSPHVYWWNGSGYEQLTEVKEDGGIAIHVSPAFEAVLEATLPRD
ncbi:hypothetical protein OHC50_07435 [Paenarthrobacter ilicis]|uniref:hypothetical protein n=1 Tax=Paenarthrobacter ilicis TaxID=43665 RepID=UPI0030083B2A